MRQFAVEGSPFTERMIFKPSELEMMSIEELRKVGLMPLSPGPIQIESFITKRFGVTPDYGNPLPDGILGLTRFGDRGPTDVFISTVLGEDTTDVGRRRTNTTLAHEAGHGLLHGHLFVLSARTNEGDGTHSESIDPSESRILCRSTDAEVPTYDWVEAQANSMIGPLLLPQPLVATLLKAEFDLAMPTKKIKQIAIDAVMAAAIVKKMTEIFDVNPVVARFRLTSLGFITQGS